MIPSVFVSSTIDDLQHLRDGIREAIDDLGYTPVMSEYGDIGYLSRTSAVDACYHSVKECQLAIVIIGKRYGCISGSESITQHEFMTAKENQIPVITLVDQEVLSFKRVYDAQAEGKKPDAFPGMDMPAKTFAFLQDVVEAPVNNGVLCYANVTEARMHLKKQIAHIFGDLLRNSFNNVNTGIKDVLSEIKTLRHEFAGGKNLDFQFLAIIRFLVDDTNIRLRKIIGYIFGPIDTSVSKIKISSDFGTFISKAEYTISITNEGAGALGTLMNDGELNYSCYAETLQASGKPSYLVSS